MKAIPLLIIGGAIALAVAMVIISAIRPLSTLELVLWQVVSLALGVYGSYKFGQNAARAAAQDVIRPHARSAVRRLLAWRDSLLSLSVRIEDFRLDGEDPRLDIIQVIIEEQLPAGDFAIEDWRDIVPEEVDEIVDWWQNK